MRERNRRSCGTLCDPDLHVSQAYGVIGCVQFLEGHYLLLVTKRQYQGSLCGHKVYSISDTALVPLKQAAVQVRVLCDLTERYGFPLQISSRRKPPCIELQSVVQVFDGQLVPHLQKEESMEEKRYRKLLLGMDLTQDFFFSYTYDVASTLQNNLTASAQQDRFDSMFVWNDHLTRCHRPPAS